jgi:hypothetical protein
MALEERNIEQYGGIIERNKACEVVISLFILSSPHFLLVNNFTSLISFNYSIKLLHISLLLTLVVAKKPQ